MFVVRSAFPAIVAALLSCLAGCSSTPQMRLDVTTYPAGAEVYISRRGEKSFRGSLGPVEGDMSSEPLEESFTLVGASPLKFASPLEERESGGTIMGVGGGVIRKYHEGVLRVEMEGYQTVERVIRFSDRKAKVELVLKSAPAAPPAAREE